MEYLTRESYKAEIFVIVSNCVIIASVCGLMMLLFIHLVDITVYHDGFHGDLNETLYVGKVDVASKKLVETAYECMMKGISIGKICCTDTMNVLYFHSNTYYSASWYQISGDWESNSTACSCQWL